VLDLILNEDVDAAVLGPAVGVVLAIRRCVWCNFHDVTGEDVYI
jgi:hypothetical protein